MDEKLAAALVLLAVAAIQWIAQAVAKRSAIKQVTAEFVKRDKEQEAKDRELVQSREDERLAAERFFRTELAKAQLKLDDARKEHEEIEDLLEKERTEREKVKAEVKAERERNDKLEATLKEREAESHKNATEIIKLKGDIDGLREQFKAAVDEKEAALALVQQRNVELSKRDDELRKRDEKIAQLEHDFTETKDKLKLAEEKLEQTERRVTELEKKKTGELPPPPELPSAAANHDTISVEKPTEQGESK